MNSSAFLLVVVGLVIIYAVITDKYYCLEGCVKCLASGGKVDSAIQLSAEGRVPNIGDMMNFPKTR
jgi:hypothetical protein